MAQNREKTAQKRYKSCLPIVNFFLPFLKKLTALPPPACVVNFFHASQKKGNRLNQPDHAKNPQKSPEKR
jgi:hypothetical protein